MSRLAGLVDVVNEKWANVRQGISRTRRRDGSAAALRLAVLWAVEGAMRPAKNIRQRRFDLGLGIETTGRVAVTDAIRSAATHPDSTRYESMSPQQISRMLARLPIDSPTHFTFLDLGSGKGLPLLLAAGYGFRRVLGVELDGGLVEVSRANVRTFEARSPAHAGVVRVTQGDAANAVLPSGPTVLFLFNPFGEATLRTVVDNIERSLKSSPRRFIVAYYKPVHRDVLDERPSLRRVSVSTRLALYEAVGW